MKMHQVLWLITVQFSEDTKSLILFIKRVSVKMLLYSGNFNLGKDFRYGQKVKATVFSLIDY